MYSSIYFLSETIAIISRIQNLILSYDCKLSRVSEVSGVTWGCLKHLLYGAGEGSSPGELAAYAQGVAPRYDRVIRLLAGRYIPHDVLLTDGRLRDDLMEELIAFCVSPIQQVSRQKLDARTWSARERQYLPSKKRMGAVAAGKIPQLDFVVRLLKAGAISLNDLVPPILENNFDGAAKSLLPARLTEENTRGFFAALKDIFALK